MSEDTPPQSTPLKICTITIDVQKIEQAKARLQQLSNAGVKTVVVRLENSRKPDEAG